MSHTHTVTEEKPLFELELATQPHNGALVSTPLSNISAPELLDLIRSHAFAELWIPYHTTDKAYCYTFHIVGKPHTEPAIGEMLLLNDNIQLIHERFGHLAQPMPVPTGE